MTVSATPGGWPNPSESEIGALLASKVGAREPGVAVGVYRAGELVTAACAGFAVVEHAAPVTPDTLFDIASASKQVTATALALLQREGKLSLDDDVRAHVPELQLRTPITLRHCLTHTGGLREYYTLCEISGVPLAGITEERLLRLIAGQHDLDFEPGSAFSYSNTGYVLAAVVIRRVTGRSVAEFAAERIFGPLGMSRTHFRDDLAVIVPGLANGYAPAAGAGPGAGPGHHRADPVDEVVGDGGIVTSIRELAVWHAFLGSGQGLGIIEVRDELLRAPVLTGGAEQRYALGLGHTTIAGRPALAHTGAIGGFRSVILNVPGERLGVSVLANRTDVYPELIAREVAELALGVPARPPAAGPVAPEVAEAARPAVLGRWHDPDRDLFVRFTASRDGRIEAVSGTERYRYALAADGRWRGEGADVGESYRLDGDRLLLGPTVEDDDWGSFVRVPEEPVPAAPHRPARRPGRTSAPSSTRSRPSPRDRRTSLCRASRSACARHVRWSRSARTYTWPAEP